MSATIQDLATNLGISTRAVRLRVDALGVTLAPFIRRGPNNRLVFTGDAIAILRHLEDVRQAEGISVKQAASIVRQREGARIEEDSAEALRQGHAEQASIEGAEWIEALIEEKDRRIGELRERIAFLEARIERLEPLAFPSPRRGLLARIRRRGQ